MLLRSISIAVSRQQSLSLIEDKSRTPPSWGVLCLWVCDGSGTYYSLWSTGSRTPVKSRQTKILSFFALIDMTEQLKITAPEGGKTTPPEAYSALSSDHLFKCLTHQGEVGKEVRPLYCYKAFGRDIDDARIISVGACNFSCPYCKRDGNFKDVDGSIITATPTKLGAIFEVVDDAISKGQVVRLSGGDPVVYPRESLAIASYVSQHHGRLSVAHNGSSPEFIKKLTDL